MNDTIKTTEFSSVIIPKQISSQKKDIEKNRNKNTPTSIIKFEFDTKRYYFPENYVPKSDTATFNKNQGILLNNNETQFVNNTKSPLKPYNCTMCCRSFAAYKNLMKHYRIHTGTFS